MNMIAVEIAVLISKPLARVSFQLARKFQGSFAFDLHQHLINWGVQSGEACESSNRRLGASTSLLSPILAIFRLLSYPASSYLSLFLGFSL